MKTVVAQPSCGDWLPSLGVLMDTKMAESYLRRSAERSARRDVPAEALVEIPVGRYTDEQLFHLELDRLFRQTWLYLLHDSELVGPGAYAVRDVAGAQVVAVRGHDGEVRAFHNACRHRGAPVARGPSGCAQLLVCGYHAWTYGLDGALVRVPDEEDFPGLDRRERSLVPIRCERWGGWWFVNLSGEADRLEQHLDPLVPLWHDVVRSPLRHVRSSACEVGANWKIVAEAFLEVYHVRSVHPRTVSPTLDVRGTVISLFDRGHQCMLTPVRPGSRTDGRDQLRQLDHVPPLMRESVQAAWGIFPNLITPLDARGFPFLVIWPTALDRTRIDVHWFAADWGLGDLPGAEHWERRLQRFDAIMDEDCENLEPIQRAVSAAVHRHLLVGYQERRIWHVHDWIDRTIGRDHIAPGLRVREVPAQWVETS